MKDCAATEVEELERLLSASVAKADRYLPRTLVERSQATFLRYMDAECLVAASVHFPGSEYPLLVSDCEIGLLSNRVEQVRYDMADAISLRG